MANLNNYSFQNQPLQQYIIQPQGLMYLINSYNELNNIPLNNVNIVAFCFLENKCYIRTLQGGAPIVTTYNLFKAEAMKMPQITEETVSMCMWNETHKMMQEWYDHIKSKIDKY